MRFELATRVLETVQTFGIGEQLVEFDIWDPERVEVGSLKPTSVEARNPSLCLSVESSAP